MANQKSPKNPNNAEGREFKPSKLRSGRRIQQQTIRALLGKAAVHGVNNLEEDIEELEDDLSDYE